MLLIAATWISDLLTGELAVASAVLAVAGVGFLLLSGRLPGERAIRIVVGCFIVFAAGQIADVLIGAAAVPSGSERSDLIAPVRGYASSVSQTMSTDPYAGAAAPVRSGYSAGDLD